MVVGKAEVRAHTDVVCARPDNAGGAHLGPAAARPGVPEQALKGAVTRRAQSLRNVVFLREYGTRRPGQRCPGLRSVEL